MDIRSYNREAWNHEVEKKNIWTVPVDHEDVERARRGEWEIILTPDKPVPRTWFPPKLNGVKLLGLASGGGQQGPILAAAGAEVTILDNAPKQLNQDRAVAQREGLKLTTIEGDMADLSAFEDESFDLAINPVSTVFVPDVKPIWREAYRVLRPGGVLMCGFCNPAVYIFDTALSEDQGVLKVMHALPYSDLKSLTDQERQRFLDRGEPLEFSHTLDTLIGSQLEAGFVLTHFFEDNWHPEAFSEVPLARYMPMFFATHALKPT